MSSKLVPANPAEVMVIRDVTPNIATFSLPFARHGIFKVGGRATISKYTRPGPRFNTTGQPTADELELTVRLTSGALAVVSPVALTPEVKAKVAAMGGRVEYVSALGAVFYPASVFKGRIFFIDLKYNRERERERERELQESLLYLII